tara:strand:+ start:7948 stop:9072 length:1125 start_codon:yes stop_codon:yes gene_type:complete
MLTNEEMDTSSFGVGRATLFCIILSFFYTWLNFRELIKSPLIISIGIFFGFFTFFSSVINLGAFSFMNIINLIINNVYWLATFVVLYLFISKNPHLVKFTINCFSLTLLFILFYYFTIAFHINYSEFISFKGLNDAYYVLPFLPFILLLKNNTLKYLGIIIIVISLIISYKRAGIIALLFSLMFYLILYFKYQQKVKKSGLKKTAFIFITIITIIFLADYSTTETGEVISMRFNSMGEDGGSGRVFIWSEVIKLQERNSFNGWILGNGYNSVKQTYINDSAHNDFLEVLYDYGLIGLFLYLILIYKLYEIYLKLKKLDWVFSIAFGSSLIIFMVLSIFSHLIIYPSYFIYIASFWGIGIGYLKNGRHQNYHFNI